MVLEESFVADSRLDAIESASTKTIPYENIF